ncbi:MAG: hypothetical protein WDN50_06105 [Bradyrhizobium sp.]
MISDRHPRTNPTVQHKQQDRNNGRRRREVRSIADGRRLDLVAKPDQRPDNIGNGDAEQHDQLAERPQQRAHDGRCLAHARHLAAGICDAVHKSRQHAGGPTDTEAGQPATMQQEERNDGKRHKKQPGIQAFGWQWRNQQWQQQ